jgi:hypothetical protein
MVVMKSQDDSGMIRSGKRMAQITGFSLGEVRRKEGRICFIYIRMNVYIYMHVKTLYSL